MSRYPILVERFPYKGASMTIVCETCHAEEEIGPDDLSNDGLYMCPKDCGEWAWYKYEEADKCPGCGVLSIELDRNSPLKGACSRVCMLQAEYVQSLRGAA